MVFSVKNRNLVKYENQYENQNSVKIKIITFFKMHEDVGCKFELNFDSGVAQK